MGISFESVSYGYPDGGLNCFPALDGLDLELAEGRLIAVLGAPGSGKSTLLQHMNGLLRPDEGRIRILDFRIVPGKGKVPSGLRKRVGLVFQFPEYQLFEETVEKDIRIGPLNFGAGESEAAEAAARAASDMGLDPGLLKRSPFQLSSGQMRKAAVAAVLASEPDILVLDEPTASLDPAGKEELMRLLSGLRRERDRTVVIVTHRLEEVLAYADDFVVLKHGKVIFHGDAATLLKRSDVLEEAGIAPPISVRIAGRIAERLGERPPESISDAAALAEWIADVIGRE